MIPGSVDITSNDLTFHEYQLRFLAAARRHGCSGIQLPNGGYTFTYGHPDAPRLSLMSGLHGDERSGPLALLHWFENSSAGSLINGNELSLYITPLVNDIGWDANRREWNNVDLNRFFMRNTPVELVRFLMNGLVTSRPSAFIDLHEDSDYGFSYVFRNTNDTHRLPVRLQQVLDASDRPWLVDEYPGSSEGFVRAIGCSLATTIEATPAWDLHRRVQWYLRALEWCIDSNGLITEIRNHKEP